VAPAVLATGVVRQAATFVTCAVFWLAVWALGPTLFGWQAVALVSGSMSPLFNPGDVVVAEPYDGSQLEPGTVIVFHAPGSGEITTHRIVGVHGDGSYRTKGDANGISDSSPVPPSAIVAVGRLRVPLIGLAIAWWQERDIVPLVLAVVVLALAGALRDRGEPPAPGRRSPSRRRLVAGRLTVVVALGVTVVMVATHFSAAVFAGNTANPGNAWASVNCAPWSAVLSRANGSTIVDTYADGQNPTTNYASSTTLSVRSTSGQNRRTFVRFSPLPTIPAGCSFKTATLSLTVTTKPASAVTYNVYNVGTAWTEGLVTWNAQPASTGSAVAVAQPSTLGKVTWDVSALVAAQYAGTALQNGFLVKDPNENTGNLYTTYASNQNGTAGNRPTLTITWDW
jgi:signal peptidase I